MTLSFKKAVGPARRPSGDRLWQPGLQLFNQVKARVQQRIARCNEALSDCPPGEIRLRVDSDPDGQFQGVQVQRVGEGQTCFDAGPCFPWASQQKKANAPDSKFCQ